MFMNTLQLKGISIIVLSIIGYFLLDNNLMQTVAGILCALGVAYVLKWLPLKRKTL